MTGSRSTDCARAVTVGLAALLELVAACHRPGARLGKGDAAKPELETTVLALSCGDGGRYAARALKARGFAVTRVQPMTSGAVIVIEGTHPQEKTTAGFDVRCEPSGVTIHPYAGERTDVEQGLRLAFAEAVKAGDSSKRAAATSPVVRLEILRGAEAVLEFPAELEPLGMVAIEVRVRNGGNRILRLDPTRLSATTAAGTQALPLPPSKAAEKLHGFGPETTAKILRPTKLKPGGQISGFVFFPVGDYRKATVSLIDDQTSEATEYDVSLVAAATP